MGDCTVERVKHVRSGKMSLETGHVEMADAVKIVTEPCGIPLFGARGEADGVCRSCLKGWEVPENQPTKRGREQIAAATGRIE